MNMQPKAKYGFTLIELMIVVIIIGILLALLGPAYMNARDAALQQKCANNLRHIGVALHLYAKDNGGYFPEDGGPGVSWGNKLAPYLDNEQVFNCPAHEDTVTDYYDTPDYWYGNTDPATGGDANPLYYRYSIYDPDWLLIVGCYDGPHNHQENKLNIAGRMYLEEPS